LGLISHIKNLLKGLGITGKHLGRHAITIQYPEERYDIPERSRGIVVLLSDKETGELNCTACELCMRACPTAAIRVVSHRDENKRKVLDEFTVDNGLCCFCGLCEEACNFSALKMATKYEFSTFTKDELIWDKKKLQEVGLDVDYVDTRKKKTAAKTVDKATEPAADKPVKPKAEAEDKTKPASADQKPAAPEQPPKAPAQQATASEPPDNPREEAPETKNEDKQQGEKSDAGD